MARPSFGDARLDPSRPADIVGMGTGFAHRRGEANGDAHLIREVAGANKIAILTLAC
jgi:hypothetical protein